MSEIIYYESEDSKICITDNYIHAFLMSYEIKDIKNGQALMIKPDQTINIAIGFVGITCILLGKIRAGQLTEILDLNVLLSATNYFDLFGLILILIALLMTLPQKDLYSMRLHFKNGKQIDLLLKEEVHYSEILKIDQAIKQAIRFANYRKNIS